MTRATVCAPVNIHSVSWVIRDLVGSNRQLGQPPSFHTALVGSTIVSEDSTHTEDFRESGCGGLGRTQTLASNNTNPTTAAAHSRRVREAGNNHHNNDTSANAILGSRDQRPRGTGLGFANVLRLGRGQGGAAAGPDIASDNDAATAEYEASLLTGLSQLRQQSHPAGTASLATLSRQQFPHYHHQHDTSYDARVAPLVDADACKDTNRSWGAGIMLPATPAGAVNGGDGGHMFSGGDVRPAVGSGNGNLSTAELQAITAVCSCLSGASLSFAVQGIMAHVATHHPCSSGSTVTPPMALPACTLPMHGPMPLSGADDTTAAGKNAIVHATYAAAVARFAAASGQPLGAHSDVRATVALVEQSEGDAAVDTVMHEE